MSDSENAIARQVRQLLSATRETLDRVDEDQAAALRDGVRKAHLVFVAGAGRTGYISRCFAMRLMHLGLAVHVVGEATAPAPGPGDLLLAFSGTGETLSTCEVALRAKDLGVPIVAVTANPRSRLAGMAGKILLLPASDSAFPLGTLFEASLYAFLDATFLVLKDELGVTDDEMSSRHALG
ncbi:MAG: SIS domain-containing protein [Planctomycetes bacterium]|nr:SIS domain-containing protein [Planctomycetota bacterium]